MDHSIDGSTVRSKDDFLTAVAAAMSFPGWFGHNLDALYDCLRDLSWLPEGEHVLVWSSPEVLESADPKAFAAVIDVLRDAVTPGRFSYRLTP